MSWLVEAAALKGTEQRKRNYQDKSNSAKGTCCPWWSQAGTPRHRPCPPSPAEHTELDPSPVRPLWLPAAGPGPALCLQSWGQAGNLSPIWQLPPAPSFLSLSLTSYRFLLSHAAAFSYFLSLLARYGFPPSFHSLPFHVFHHFFFSGSFDVFDASFASGHSRKAAVPLWHPEETPCLKCCQGAAPTATIITG